MYELAGEQHGVITRRQAGETGLSKRMIDLRIGADWRRIHPNVFTLPGTPPTREQQLWGAWLACGFGSVFSHRTAAAWWGIDRAGESMIELTVPRSCGRKPEGVTLHRLTDLADHHVRWREGLPVTSPARTLVDLGAVLRPRRVERALEMALADRLVTFPAIHQVMSDVARKGRTGVGVLRRILDDRPLREQIPDGLLEPAMARLVRDHCVPEPVFQHEVRGDGKKMKIDFSYPDLMIAIEVDGYEWHRTREQLQDDAERQNLLVMLGWKVLRFTWRQVRDRPEWVAAQILRFLGVASNARGR